jgi:hypothetical protein
MQALRKLQSRKDPAKVAANGGSSVSVPEQPTIDSTPLKLGSAVESSPSLFQRPEQMISSFEGKAEPYVSYSSKGNSTNDVKLGERKASLLTAENEQPAKPFPDMNASLQAPPFLLDATLALEQEQMATAQLLQPKEHGRERGAQSRSEAASSAGVCSGDGAEQEREQPTTASTPMEEIRSAKEERVGAEASRVSALEKERQALLTHVEMLQAQVEAVEASSREMQARWGWPPRLQPQFEFANQP